MCVWHARLLRFVLYCADTLIHVNCSWNAGGFIGIITMGGDSYQKSGGSIKPLLSPYISAPGSDSPTKVQNTQKLISQQLYHKQHMTHDNHYTVTFLPSMYPIPPLLPPPHPSPSPQLECNHACIHVRTYTQQMVLLWQHNYIFIYMVIIPGSSVVFSGQVYVNSTLREKPPVVAVHV